MNVKEYIKSGIIEDYCLGLLSPEEMQAVALNAREYQEVRHEIETYEHVLVQYAAGLAEGNPKERKKDILDLLDNLADEENISAENLPIINKYSDAGTWLRFVKPLLPEKLPVPFIIHYLPAKNGVEQFIFWTHHDLPHETHDDEQETILLLEGHCRCFVDDEVIELQPGDFLSIPLHKQHNVEILHGPVMAVIQRVKVA
ncbi:MAG TPA: cupin domain-containing protein [Chitinophagaceae bacterium]|nr:cupin domain-containing protein [Chitinophagaceae bacterium]